MLAALLHLIFPNNCKACREAIPHQLKDICLKCRNEFPRFKENFQEGNELDKLFWGKIKLEKTAAFLKFEKGSKVQEVIHQLKYKGKKELGITLGTMAAIELASYNFFDDIDFLIPVPIHPLKERVRGYNQSEFIATGIHEITDIPVTNKLIKKGINTGSQTRKSRFKRWQNVSSSFTIQDRQAAKGKHLLLVDDVLTTGSTIEACALELMKIEGVKVSLLALAYTY